VINQPCTTLFGGAYLNHWQLLEPRGFPTTKKALKSLYGVHNTWYTPGHIPYPWGQGNPRRDPPWDCYNDKGVRGKLTLLKAKTAMKSQFDHLLCCSSRHQNGRPCPMQASAGPTCAAPASGCCLMATLEASSCCRATAAATGACQVASDFSTRLAAAAASASAAA